MNYTITDKANLPLIALVYAFRLAEKDHTLSYVKIQDKTWYATDRIRAVKVKIDYAIEDGLYEITKEKVGYTLTPKIGEFPNLDLLISNRRFFACSMSFYSMLDFYILQARISEYMGIPYIVNWELLKPLLKLSHIDWQLSTSLDINQAMQLVFKDQITILVMPFDRYSKDKLQV